MLIEFGGWVCPLTQLENYLRERGGAQGYQGQFIEHHVLPLLYPSNMTRNGQIVLGVFAFAINVLVYTRARRKPLAVNWSVPANVFTGGRTQSVTVNLVQPAASTWSGGARSI